MIHPITLLCVALLSLQTVRSNNAPNIIVILLDDMGFSDFGCYGSEIPTPHIDELAGNGVRFTQFHNTGRCSPTRASLLTGLYPHQAGMGHLDSTVKPGSLGFQGKLRNECVTIAEVLGEAGYFTAMTGKWHLGQSRGTPPSKRGFHRNLTIARGGIYYSNQTGSKGGASLYHNGEEIPSNAALVNPPWYGTDLWTDWGLKFIREATEEDKPFFLYLAHVAPHFPCMAPEETIAKYRGKYLSGWDSLRHTRHKRQIDMGLVDPEWALPPRPKNIPAWNTLSDAKKSRYDDMMAIYAATIEEVDKNVGKLTAALSQMGQLDNTLILILSDNGGNAEGGVKGIYNGDQPGDPHSNVFIGQCWAHLNNTPFRKYKHYVHEGGTSTPLIAHWPATIPSGLNGTFNSTPGHTIDIMSTAVDIANASYPIKRGGHSIKPMEGTSLLPLLKGKTIERKNPIFFEHEANRAVRSGDWKLVSLSGKPWELYNLKTDRTETHDLSKQHPERVEKMADQWDNWATHADCDAWQRPRKPKKNTKQRETRSKQSN